jgi:hypothetical protein
MRRIRLLCPLALFLAWIWVTPAHAQIGIESIFKDINELGFFFGCWSTQSSTLQSEGECPVGNRDFGVEATYRVAEIPLTHFGGKAGRDSLVVRQVTVKGSDTTRTYDPHTGSPTGPQIHFEFALGYSQFSGFRSADPQLDLRGSVREIPAVTLYTSFHYDQDAFVFPYAGVRSGLIQLRDVQAFTDPQGSDTAVAYAGEAQSFQLGAVAGVGLRYMRATIFGEWAWMSREFSSIRWTADKGRVPTSLPRRLDFGGRSFSIGMQFNIR